MAIGDATSDDCNDATATADVDCNDAMTMVDVDCNDAIAMADADYNDTTTMALDANFAMMANGDVATTTLDVSFK